MKSTLSDNKQLFNVNAIAAAGLDPIAIPEGEVGIVDSSTELTVDPANFAALPDRYRLVSKLGGKVYFSFEEINKADSYNQVSQDYTAEVVNVWSTTIESCDCTKAVQLIVNMDDHSLIQRDGLTWTHADSIYEISPAELDCLCDCTGKGVYDNNVMTDLLATKINANNSPYYSASVRIDVTPLTTYADAAALAAGEPAPAQGDLAIQTDITAVVQYDGAAWNPVANDLTGIMTDIDTFIATNKDVNTDDNLTNDKEKLELVLTGKAQSVGLYRDLEVNYVYPRGVRMKPSLIVNGNKATTFTEDVALGFELGSGYDLRAEEFECMSLYTNLNHYPQLSDGIQSPNLIYQFENNTNYDVVNFEFDTQKVERAGDSDMKRFAILLATTSGAVYTKLKDIFIP